MNKQQIISSVSISVLITALFVILPFEIMDAVTYKIWGESENRPDGEGKWCEKAYHNENDKFIREQMNARSDYVYVVLGVWMIVVSIFDFKSGVVYADKVGDVYQTQKEDASNLHHDVVEDVVVEDGLAVENVVEDGLVYAALPVVLRDASEIQQKKSKEDGEGENHINEQDDEQEDHNTDTIERHTTITIIQEDDQVNIEEEIPNAIVAYPAIGLVNGLVNIFHGLGSFFNHTCQCGYGGTADVAGMLSVMIFPSLYLPVIFVMGLKNPSAKLIKCITLIPILGQPFLLVIFWIVPQSRGSVVPVVIFVLNVALYAIFFVYVYLWRNKQPLGRRQQLNIYYAAATLVTLAFGYLAWQLDMSKIWCSQNPSLHGLQLGHVVWHVFTCGSLLSFYLLCRTEVITSNWEMNGVHIQHT